MDALSHILKATSWAAKLYHCTAGDEPWCMQVLYRPQGVFHVVLDGSCYLRQAGFPEPLLLEKGDVIAFPTGGDHRISGTLDGLGLRTDEVLKVDGDDQVMIFKHGELGFSTEEPGEFAGGATRLLTGTLSYDTSIQHPLLKGLPCTIHVNQQDEEARQALHSVVNVMLAECKHDTSGAALAIDRLSEVLFLQLLRCHVANSSQPEGYFAALSDPNIGVALNIIHMEDDGSLTVESLCEAAAMSRTSFNTRFLKLIGETPKAYLTNSRLLRAKTELQHSRTVVSDIAQAAGYASESSFSKAIKKHFGMTPGELRKAGG